MYYTDFESMIGMALLFGILSLCVSIGGFVLIAVAIARLAGRSAAQAPGTPGAQPNRGLLWQLLTVAAMVQGRHPVAGQPGSAEASARQSVIDAGLDPTRRP